jgi:predicted PurR-regulated permease PerM
MDRVVSTPEIDKSTIPEPVTRPLIASWVLAGIGLLLIPFFHLISALVAGLLVYELVSSLAPIIERHLISRWSRWLAVAGLAILTITALILAGIAITASVKSEINTPHVLSTKLNEILTEARSKLPSFLTESFPGDVDDLKTYASNWVDEHAKEIQEFGNSVLHFFVRHLHRRAFGFNLRRCVRADLSGCDP